MVGTLVSVLLFLAQAQCAPDLGEDDIGGRSFVDPRNQCFGRTQQSILKFGIPTVVHRDDTLDQFVLTLEGTGGSSAFDYVENFFSSRNVCIEIDAIELTRTNPCGRVCALDDRPECLLQCDGLPSEDEVRSFALDIGTETEMDDAIAILADRQYSIYFARTG